MWFDTPYLLFMHYILIFLVALPKGKLNSKKPPKAGQLSASKKKGGLGVINLSTHNDALLLKTLHIFFNRIDLPWVSLVWENYYGNGTLPILANKGSF
jgi:hypothetical protein